MLNFNNENMKKFYSNYSILLAIILMGFSSCSDEFLERPPEDTYSLDEFYSTNEQVEASTNALYGKTWFFLHNKTLYAIAEVGGGNAFTYSSDVNGLRLLNITSTDPVLTDAWKSCFATVAQSNSLINLLPSRVGNEVNEEVLNNTLGEAHFMRALSYFYLVRLWRAVPIIENNAAHVNEPQLNTNPEEDIYRFIESDLNYAIENLYAKTRGSNYEANGHVSKGSARALLAKVLLYQEKYDEARAMAEQVINSGEFKLFGGEQLPNQSFGDLYKIANNNNEESIVAWQWTLGNYFTGNYLNTMFAYSSIINNSTYGGTFAPSQDLLDAFEPGDLRRKQTVMLPGDYYPDLPSANGPDFTVPDDIDPQNAGAGIKKYVVGKNGITDGNGGSPNNTYIMRYGELFLIHAEAILAGAQSTADPAALESYNTIRERAGLQPVNSFTFDDLLHERRIELAFEGDYWFDLGRISPQKAVEIVAAQNRGDEDNPEYADPRPTDFILPYPSSELILNPKLGQDPVPYNFD